MRDVVKIFKALSDPNRIRILKMLEIRPLCVCEITKVLNLATSTVSKHLSILRDVELILDQKEGKWVTYRLNNENPPPHVEELMPMVSQWLADEPLVLKDQEKIRKFPKDHICEI